VEFLADCKAPETRQRLHLLALGARGDSGDEVKRRALRAARDAPGGGGPATTSFDPVIVYGPLVGYRVSPEYIYNQLAMIRAHILDLGCAGPAANDVVLIYYRGGESVDQSGNFLRTDAGPGAEAARCFGIPCA